MTQNNLKIAITGGIGSGKSTVSQIIKEQGYTVFSCDEIYKNLLCDKKFLNILSDEFGDILNEEGKLDRKKLSEIVFADKDKLKRLDEITHPAIMNNALTQMNYEQISFCEVPLLFEGGYEKLFNNVIVVLRDKKLRAAAVAKRDNLEENEITNRINSQYDYDNAQFKKYYVIHNNSNLADLRIQTLEIISKII